MTPEERLQKIENSLNTTAENLAHFHAALEAQRMHMEAQRIQHDREIAEIRGLQNVMAAGVIRMHDAHAKFESEFNAGMERLRQAQETTEEKLNALIETVDRIIRDRNK